jgi:hypothetical protein
MKLTKIAYIGIYSPTSTRRNPWVSEAVVFPGFYMFLAILKLTISTFEQLLFLAAERTETPHTH